MRIGEVNMLAALCTDIDAVRGKIEPFCLYARNECAERRADRFLSGHAELTISRASLFAARTAVIDALACHDLLVALPD